MSWAWAAQGWACSVVAGLSGAGLGWEVRLSRPVQQLLCIEQSQLPVVTDAHMVRQPRGSVAGMDIKQLAPA